MRPSPTARGFKSVMLSEEASRLLGSYPGSASTSVMKLTSRVEQLEADIAALRDELQRLTADGAPTEEWLTYALGRLKIRDATVRNNWRRVANLPDEKAEEWR